MVMTPHEWLCESSAYQSIVVDFLNENKFANGEIRVRIDDKSDSENSFEIIEKIQAGPLMKVDFQVKQEQNFKV